ncbi:unnamed protein product [Paramecium sonneborni]|uniref:Uncharacterized protein n=1 Tax=Paramecium sonneborni TaxID=65129 RepID=A0A8S1Q8D7_9CILI|nr:unnamed protein product [Paramecium sonneborni]
MTTMTQNSNQIVDLIDFDVDQIIQSGKPSETQQTDISNFEKSEDDVKNESFIFRNKQLDQEIDQINSQIDQMIKHLNQMKIMSEKKIENFDVPENPLQRNMMYMRKFTFTRIQALITQMKIFKEQRFPSDLSKLYEIVEPKMGEFYQNYNSLYFDIKMFMDRYRFYKSEDNERDTKIITQIIIN